jgi:rhomboid family GlyGly-CTERM serine protease
LNALNLPLSWRHLLPFITLTVICAFSFFFDTQIGQFLEYDRQAIHSAQFWRFISAHIAHTNGYHLGLNLAGLALIWALHGEKYYSINFFCLFCFTSLIISTGITFFSPELQRYVGLSGLLHGLFIFGACDDVKQGYKTGYLMIAGTLIKIMQEQIKGPSVELGEKINAVVAIDAHLYGVIAGFVAYCISLIWALHNTQQSSTRQ